MNSSLLLALKSPVVVGAASFGVGWLFHRRAVKVRMDPILNELEKKYPKPTDYQDYKFIVRAALGFKQDFSGIDDETWCWR